MGRESGGELGGEAEGLDLDEDRGVSSANVTIAPPPLPFHSDGGKKKKRIDGGLHGKAPAGMEGDWQWYWAVAKEEEEEAARRDGDGDGGNRLDAKKKTRKASSSSSSRVGERVKGRTKREGKGDGGGKEREGGVPGGMALIRFQGEGGERVASGFDVLEFKYDPLVGRGGGEGQGGKMEGGKEERAQEQGQGQRLGLGLGLGLEEGDRQLEEGVARGGVNGPVAEDSLQEGVGGVEAMEALPGGMADRPPGGTAAEEEEAECQVVEPPHRDRDPGKGRGGGRRRRGGRQVARSCFLCRKYFKEGCVVAALVNREQREVACSSRNRKGVSVEEGGGVGRRGGGVV